MASIRGARIIFSLSLVLLVACCSLEGSDDDGADDDDDTADDDSTDAAVRPFPEGFLFGAATAGFQVEMGCPTLPAAVCDDRNSDWYQFVTSPETVNDPLAFVEGDDPSVMGPGHWELFADDFDLAADDLGLNSFRLSIEWSRIFPQPTFGVEGYENLLAIADKNAIAHYHQVFAALAQRGLTPLVTLNHYTLPLWIHDGVACHEDLSVCTARGWLDRQVIVEEISKFAGFTAREFGGEVDLWTTLNEPLAVLVAGFLAPTPTRSNPPALFLRFDEFKTAMAAMIEAHARMVDSVRQNDLIDVDSDGKNALVGIVYAMSPVIPADPSSELDRQAADNLFYLWNMAFLNAVAKGQFDAELDGQPVYREDLADRMDFIGLNYYARITTGGLPFSILPWLSPLFNVDLFSVKFDEIYPRGIYEMSEVINRDLGVPVIVTENNSRSDSDDTQAKEMRYLVEHLSWLWYGLEHGSDIRGYFYWSLIDNYEWNQGMKDYGLYEVRLQEPGKPRIAREIVDVYRSIAEAGGITRDLAERYPMEYPFPEDSVRK